MSTSGVIVVFQLDVVFINIAYITMPSAACEAVATAIVLLRTFVAETSHKMLQNIRVSIYFCNSLLERLGED